jgi:hypothetical protein
LSTAVLLLLPLLLLPLLLLLLLLCATLSYFLAGSEPAESACS